MLILSLLWSTIVGLFGLEEERPWGSFFLQYLWEFGLGMWIAERIYEGRRGELMDIKEIKWRRLLAGAVGGMVLSAVMAWNGGWLKLYNDIPSLFGYLCVALLIYKVGINYVNRFYEWASGFSYELYLTHVLVYTVIAYFIHPSIPVALMLMISFMSAYIVAFGYRSFVKFLFI